MTTAESLAMGFRRAIVHIALIALLLRGFLPAGWMPAAHGEAPLVMCSIIQTADTGDGHTGDGDGVPGKDDPRAHENCAFAAAPAINAPDQIIFFDPVLQDDSDLEDDDTVQVRALHHGPAPQVPRAPPFSI